MTSSPFDIDDAELMLHPAKSALDVSCRVILALVSMQRLAAPQTRLVCGVVAHNTYRPLIDQHPDTPKGNSPQVRPNDSSAASSAHRQNMGVVLSGNPYCLMNAGIPV